MDHDPNSLPPCSPSGWPTRPLDSTSAHRWSRSSSSAASNASSAGALPSASCRSPVCAPRRSCRSTCCHDRPDEHAHSPRPPTVDVPAANGYTPARLVESNLAWSQFEPDSAAAVSFLNGTAELTGDGPFIAWSTAPGLDSGKAAMWRSDDGLSWQQLDNVPGLLVGERRAARRNVPGLRHGASSVVDDRLGAVDRHLRGRRHHVDHARRSPSTRPISTTSPASRR